MALYQPQGNNQPRPNATVVFFILGVAALIILIQVLT